MLLSTYYIALKEMETRVRIGIGQQLVQEVGWWEVMYKKTARYVDEKLTREEEIHRAETGTPRSYTSLNLLICAL